MITIVDLHTGEEYKCYQANKSQADKDSFCTDFVTYRWLNNWMACIDYYIPIASQGNKQSFQILLKDGLVVKGF